MSEFLAVGEAYEAYILTHTGIEEENLKFGLSEVFAFMCVSAMPHCGKQAKGFVREVHALRTVQSRCRDCRAHGLFFFFFFFLFFFF